MAPARGAVLTRWGIVRPGVFVRFDAVVTRHSFWYPLDKTLDGSSGCRCVREGAIDNDLPDVDETCAYCGSLIFDHDPICVRDCTDAHGSRRYFCNYPCLSTYVDENNLTTGDACE